jgi:hypothetical protein
MIGDVVNSCTPSFTMEFDADAKRWNQVML